MLRHFIFESFFQRGGRQARLPVGPALRGLPGEVPARRRGELGGVQSPRPGDAGDGVGWQHDQGVEVGGEGEAAGTGSGGPAEGAGDEGGAEEARG